MCGLGNSSLKECEFFKDVMDVKMFRFDEVVEGVMVGFRDDYGIIIFINVNVGEGVKIIFCLVCVIIVWKMVFFFKGMWRGLNKFFSMSDSGVKVFEFWMLMFVW